MASPRLTEAISAIHSRIVNCPVQMERGQCEVLRRAPKVKAQETVDASGLLCTEKCPLKGHAVQDSDLPQLGY